jgi:hypothetical protein
MAYLGNAPARSFISFERQVFTIVNSQTAYTLSHSVNNENDIRLVINNIVQEPGSGKAYTASGTTLTLSAALTNGTDEMYCVFLGRAVATNAPGAGSVNTAAIAADAVTEAKIADDAVESEHLNDNVISGQTELAAEPADTDEFLVSDAGTLKRIDYSHIKGGGITEADQWRLTTDFTTSGTTISSGWERDDTNGSTYIGTGMTESSGIFTFPSTGKYLILWTPSFLIAQNNTQIQSGIETTTDNSSYNSRANTFGGGNGTSLTSYGAGAAQILFDVTSTSTHKARFVTGNLNSGSAIRGNTSYNFSEALFLRLGDT